MEEQNDSNPCENCSRMWEKGACMACEYGNNDDLNVFGGEE